jgi:hypothetical protein
LGLENNQLTGTIPKVTLWLLGINVQHNLLTGDATPFSTGSARVRSCTIASTHDQAG